MSRDTVVLIPTLGRPHHVEPLLESLYSSTDEARALFICNSSDAEAIAEISRVGADYIKVNTAPMIVGDYAKKINAGYRRSSEPYMFLGATDLVFHRNWLEIAKEYLSDTIHVVGTNDRGNIDVMAGKHSTHSLVTREYADEYGVIDNPRQVLCEEYWHEFVDNEFCETARYRGAFAMAINCFVEHLHPAYGKGVWDRAYRLSPRRTTYGLDVYNRRKHLWGK